MIKHSELGLRPFQRTRRLKDLIDGKEVAWGGNGHLKIYGRLNCSSGKRMDVDRRIFFKSEKEAIEAGFRPCGNCMRAAYLEWKAAFDKLLHK